MEEELRRALVAFAARVSKGKATSEELAFMTKVAGFFEPPRGYAPEEAAAQYAEARRKSRLRSPTDGTPLCTPA